jgi:hypothetical protein
MASCHVNERQDQNNREQGADRDGPLGVTFEHLKYLDADFVVFAKHVPYLTA